MFKNLINSLLIVITTFSNFLAVCSEDKGRSGEVHFILEACEAHECHRNDSTPQCNSELCDHQSCNDKAIFDVFHIPQQVKYSHFEARIPFDFCKPFTTDQLLIVCQTIYCDFPQLSSSPRFTTVLRI
jgi:hypothetical protein